MSGRCIICDENFDPSEIAALKCGHTFHLQCVSNWLKNSGSCPICRRQTSKDSDVIPQLFFGNGEDSLAGASHNQEHSKVVSELFSKVKFLESELTKSTNLAKAKDDKVSGLETEVKVLETALTKSIREATTRQLDAMKAENEVVNLRRAIISVNQVNVELKETNSRLEEELRKKIEKDQLLTLVKTSQTAVDQMKARNAELMADNERLKNDLDKLQTMAKLVCDDANSDDTAAQLENATAKALKASLEVIKKKVHDLTAENLGLLNRTRVFLEQERASLKKQNDDSHALVHSMEQELACGNARQQKAGGRGERDHSPKREVGSSPVTTASVHAQSQSFGDTRTRAEPVTHQYGLRSIGTMKSSTVGGESVGCEPKRGGKAAASKIKPSTPFSEPSSKQEEAMPAVPKKKRRS